MLRIRDLEDSGRFVTAIIEVTDDRVRSNHIKDVLDSVQDYVDYDGNVDKELLLNELLGFREYTVQIDKSIPEGKRGRYLCSCKNGVYRFGSKCKHVKLVLNELEKLNEIQ